MMKDMDSIVGDICRGMLESVMLVISSNLDSDK